MILHSWDGAPPASFGVTNTLLKPDLWRSFLRSRIIISAWNWTLVASIWAQGFLSCRNVRPHGVFSTSPNWSLSSRSFVCLTGLFTMSCQWSFEKSVAHRVKLHTWTSSVWIFGVSWVDSCTLASPNCSNHPVNKTWSPAVLYAGATIFSVFCCCSSLRSPMRKMAISSGIIFLLCISHCSAFAAGIMVIPEMHGLKFPWIGSGSPLARVKNPGISLYCPTSMVLDCFICWSNATFVYLAFDVLTLAVFCCRGMSHSCRIVWIWSCLSGSVSTKSIWVSFGSPICLMTLWTCLDTSSSLTPSSIKTDANDACTDCLWFDFAPPPTMVGPTMHLKACPKWSTNC